MGDVGKIIKDARLAKGLTQEELGNIVGVQKSAIAKYETGRVVNIKRSTLKGLAKALDLKGSDLIGEEIKKDPEEAGKIAAEILRDQDLMEIFSIFQTLTEGQKQQVKEFIHFIAR